MHVPPLTSCILETTLDDHNCDRCRSPIRCFHPNPGVLISDNDYKTQQGGLHVLQGAPWCLAHQIPGECGEQGCRPPALCLQPSHLSTKSSKVIGMLWHFSPSLPLFLSLSILYVLFTVIDYPPTHFLIPTHALSSHPRLLSHSACFTHLVTYISYSAYFAITDEDTRLGSKRLIGLLNLSQLWSARVVSRIQ